MKMLVERKIIGYKALPDTDLKITDPCYDDGDFGTMHVDLPAGEYRMAVYKCVEPKEDAGRTMIIELQKKHRSFKLESKKWECIGSIGVDAGMAGFFWNKPDFSDDEWRKFCDDFDFKKGHKDDDYGFYSSSGYGDGMYDVYAIKEDDQIIALKICF